MKHFLHKHILSDIHRTVITVVGCGGTGSHVLSGLARMDYALRALGRKGLVVVAYDLDNVEPHNIGRQLFYEQDIGENKAITIIERINLTYGLDWTAYSCKYQEKPNTASIIITCLDSIAQRIEVMTAFKKAKNHVDYPKIYWMDYGNEYDIGQVIIGSLDESEKNRMPCVHEIFNFSNITDDPEIPSCSMADSLSKQGLYTNSILAQLGLNMLFQLLSYYYLEYHGVYMNLTNGDLSYIKLK